MILPLSSQLQANNGRRVPAARPAPTAIPKLQTARREERRERQCILRGRQAAGSFGGGKGQLVAILCEI